MIGPFRFLFWFFCFFLLPCALRIQHDLYSGMATTRHKIAWKQGTTNSTKLVVDTMVRLAEKERSNLVKAGKTTNRDHWLPLAEDALQYY
jgi:hypothetical protein